MTTKAKRHHAILRILASTAISNQSEVRRMLASRGIEATQATISRDLEELGVVKSRDAQGRLRYAVPSEAAPAPALPDQLRRVMGEWVTEVTPSGTLVVVRTPPGCAHVVASALDRSALAGLIGTVAGDDTIMCVASESVGGRSLAKLLADLAGISPTMPRVAPGRASSSRRSASAGRRSGHGR